jgi:hypothetical protein
MKRFIWLIFFMPTIFELAAQNITAAEYFFDTDPGKGNGNAITVPTPGTTVTLNANISTASLSQGFHSLGIRTMDATGVWSLYESRVVFITSSTSDAGPITSAEYFIDADPGPGNGTSVSVGASGNTVTFTASIPTASLSNGFHTLGLRTKNSDGVWSLYESRGFYISSSGAVDAPMITAAEYFFDSDPGVGNGTPVSVGASGNTVTFTANISIASLSNGFHILAIRTRDAAGVWSLYESRAFYITAGSTDAPPISGAEYFIDHDPGVGNGTAISVGATGNTVVFTASIPTASLSNGFHTLAIRSRNTDGVWSLYQTGTFYISAATGNMPPITNAEYFIDTDPGVGNGSALTVTTPGDTINQTFICNVPGGTSNGTHILAIRTRDANGTWSLFETRTFDVAGSLPLNWLSFSGRRINEKIQLSWITENELNTSHFEVERSANGIDFTLIGKVTALSRSHNEYQFDDVQPLKGINFYRLKQEDRDGHFEYSRIVKILWSDNKNTLRLYPNPVRKNLYLQFTGTEKNVSIQIYDAAGRFVQNRRMQNQSVLMIPVRNLSSGTYWIIISDGITLEKGRFVKE